MTQTDENLTGVAALLNPKTDYYQVFADVDGEDLEWWQKAREFMEWARPSLNESWEKAEYNIPAVEEAARRGLVTDGIEIDGQPGISIRANRLIQMELARTDASTATAHICLLYTSPSPRD